MLSPTGLAERVNSDATLLRRGRHVRADLMLEIGEERYLIPIRDGYVGSVRPGPHVMPSWTFALRADTETWELFCQPVPPPGFHDLFALLRARRLRLEGDVRPFMTNLLYFKGLVAKLRTEVDA